MSHFCHSLSTKAGRVLTTYNDEPTQDFGPKMGGGGGCYAVGVYSALYGATNTHVHCLKGLKSQSHLHTGWDATPFNAFSMLLLGLHHPTGEMTFCGVIRMNMDHAKRHHLDIHIYIYIYIYIYD